MRTIKRSLRSKAPPEGYISLSVAMTGVILILIGIIIMGYLFILKPIQQQNQLLALQLQAMANRPTDKVPLSNNPLPPVNILIPALAGNNPLVTSPNITLGNLPAIERGATEALSKALNIPLGEASSLLQNLINQKKKLGVKITTDASSVAKAEPIKITPKEDDKKPITDMSKGELKQSVADAVREQVNNTKIETIVKPKAEIIELPTKHSRWSAIYSTYGQGMSYTVGEGRIPFVGKINYDAMLIKRRGGDDLAVGLGVSKDLNKNRDYFVGVGVAVPFSGTGIEPMAYIGVRF